LLFLDVLVRMSKIELKESDLYEESYRVIPHLFMHSKIKNELYIFRDKRDKQDIF